MAKETTPTIDIELTADDVRVLRQLAHVYEKAISPVRLLVRATSSREMRQRFRFVAEESTILANIAESIRRDMTASGRQAQTIALPVRTLVAYWGRVLSNLENRRTRRRLSETEVRLQQELAAKLEAGAHRIMERGGRRILERELDLRRPVEAGWMRERLQLSADA